MIDDLTSRIPPLAAGSELACPVDGCGQRFSTEPPRVRWSGDSWTSNQLIVHGVTVQAVEEVLAAHMATHTAVEFLKTIQARDWRIAELEQESARREQ